MGGKHFWFLFFGLKVHTKTGISLKIFKMSIGQHLSLLGKKLPVFAETYISIFFDEFAEKKYFICVISFIKEVFLHSIFKNQLFKGFYWLSKAEIYCYPRD